MRNLGLVVALWLAAWLPTNGLALGLGEIEVKSFLNQPLDAEIEVISARPGEIDDLLVSLASREAFTRAGLSRPRYLSDLRFTVQKNEEGDQAVILVTTKNNVKEPFLNFLIEADWSKGRLLREFTVLLDPPFFADQPAPVEPVAEAEAPAVSDEASVSEIVEQSGVTPIVESDTAVETDSVDDSITEPIALSEEVPDTEPETSSQDFTTTQTTDIPTGDVLVVKGDTLWSIASRYKDDAHSMAQVMLAFQRANPDAFTDGNINNMKEGAILRAPSLDEIDALGQQEAYAEVLVQNGLWDEYVARVTGVSPAVAVEDEAEAEMPVSEDEAGEESGELSLLLPGDGETESTGTGDATELDDLRTKLAMAEEELEAARVENQELESRIAELQARLSKVEELQKMVEIEDDSLAQIQADQADEEAPAVEPEPVVEETTPPESVSEAIEADEEALLEELLAEEAAAQAEEQAMLEAGDEEAAATDDQMSDDAMSDDTMSDDTMAEDAMTDDAMGDDAMAEDALTDDAMTEETPAADEMAAEETEQAPPPAPVVVTEPVTRAPSIFDGILPPEIIDMIPSMPSVGGLFADPLILAAIGGVVVLLLILFLVKRRRGSGEEEPTIAASTDEDLFAGEEEEELTPIHLADGGVPEETDIKVPSEDDIAAEPEPTEAVEDLSSTATASAEDLPEPEEEAPAAAAEGAGDQDDVLNEVDVYLAYGLYDNAEELLSSSLTENPERADYRSKLLDTYFATKNVDAFVSEAEKLKSMGDPASRYWDRVQVMGYELAPDNALFSDAKDSGLSAADLEIAKPQEADFDLGASEDDDTNFSTTDFQLGEEDTDSDFSDTATMGEAGEIAATQQIPQIDELPSLEDEDDTNVRPEAEAEDETGLDLPEEIGEELEFSMEEEPTGGEDDAMAGLDLPDDLDLGTEEAIEEEIGAEFEAALEADDGLDLDDSELVAFEPDLDEGTLTGLEADDDAVELDVPADGDDDGQTETAIITPNYEDTAVMPEAVSEPNIDEDSSDIDLGMEDTAMMVGDTGGDETGELNLDTGELVLPSDADVEDDEDISIIDFGGDDFVEPTDVVESVAEDDSVAMDVDVDDESEVQTGTFAPGDFEEPTAATEALSDIDDIGDLMLPDDVDEVSTKLDLARAFIDMGDTEGARGSLEEVIAEGNADQKAEAQSLLEQI